MVVSNIRYWSTLYHFCVQIAQFGTRKNVFQAIAKWQKLCLQIIVTLQAQNTPKFLPAEFWYYTKQIIVSY